MLLSFFRINDPLRAIGLLVFMLFLWTPWFFMGFPFINTEIKWMVVGEMMADGANMYKGILDNTAPFTAGAYWLVNVFSGKNLLLAHCVSFILLFVEALLFNDILNRKGVYNEKSYLPALSFALFSNMVFDVFTLNPVLFALLPLLLVIRNLLRTDLESDENVFSMGFFVGLAALFYLPAVVFLFFIWIGYALFRTLSPRFVVLVSTGMVIPFFFALAYFFMVDGMEEFYQNFLFASVGLDSYHLIDFKSMFLILLVPAVLVAYAIARTFGMTGFVNFQSNAQKIFLIWIAASFGALFFTKNISTYHFLLFVPALAFFIPHWLLDIYKKWKAELLLVSLIVYFFVCNIPFLEEYTASYRPDYSKVESGLEVKERGLSVLVLGNSYGYYKYNQQAGPYLNWQMSKAFFENLDDYGAVLQLYESFARYKPDLIVDEKHIVPSIFKKMPLLQKNYEVNPTDSTYYYLKGESFADEKP